MQLRTFIKSKIMIMRAKCLRPFSYATEGLSQAISAQKKAKDLSTVLKIRDIMQNE